MKARVDGWMGGWMDGGQYISAWDPFGDRQMQKYTEVRIFVK